VVGWCCFFFSFCLSEAAAWSAPPLVGFSSWSLYVVLRFWNQLHSPPVVLIWRWVFTVLDYSGLVSLPLPLLWSKVNNPSAGSLLSTCCDGLLIVFQFCSVVWLWMLLPEISGPLAALFQAAAYHLPAVSPSAFLVFIYWKFMQKSAPCHPPFFYVLSESPPLLLCGSFQFAVYSVFFFQGVGLSACPGWFIPGVAGGILRDTWHSPVWSAECLPSRFGAGMWWQRKPSYFLSVTWRGEAFYRL
jgi:hypothetical protein